MKIVSATAFLLITLASFAQKVPVQQPIEEQHPTNYLWWAIGVLLALGGGIALYMAIKKDPKRDAVR